MGEPVFLALLTADRVIVEKNDKKGIIGTFNRLASPKFPARFPQWWIYASVANLVGTHSFTLFIAEDETGKRIFNAAGNVEIQDVSQVVELTIPVAKCTFPTAGSYTVLFELDGAQVGARILKVDRLISTPAQG